MAEVKMQNDKQSKKNKKEVKEPVVETKETPVTGKKPTKKKSGPAILY